MRQKHRFHGLKKTKVRQTWNKYNLYNLQRLKPLYTAGATFFQQKWYAKSATRAYHGEYIREKQWQKMFKPFAPAVVPLDAGDLARSNGSDQAEGRGSGKDVDPRKRGRTQAQIPYMAMVYGPMERRLDSAIFRALFASSARQARQFVTHGAVKVNGKKMIYPGYLLNPGDMFQVDADQVMYATGMQKEKVKERLRKAWAVEREKKEAGKEEAKAAAEQASEEETSEAQAEESQPEVEGESEPPSDKSIKKEKNRKRKEAINRVKAVILKGKTTLSGKRLQELRALIPQIHEVYTSNTLEAMDKALKPIMYQLINPTNRNARSNPEVNEAAKEEKPSSEEIPSSDSPTTYPKTTPQPPNIPLPDELQHADKYRTAAEREEISAILARIEELRENPVDPQKPYATPWKPRPFMAPFAFIPRYLEVNQNICAAVYLRHPVARPGLAEVPSPFNFETSQLAFNWYLRRR